MARIKTNLPASAVYKDRFTREYRVEDPRQSQDRWFAGKHHAMPWCEADPLGQALLVTLYVVLSTTFLAKREFAEI